MDALSTILLQIREITERSGRIPPYLETSEDLYHRLVMLTGTVPELRDRGTWVEITLLCGRVVEVFPHQKPLK